MRFTGLILIVIGIIGLWVGGTRYNRQRAALELGSFRATEPEQRPMPSAPIVGAIVLLGGTLLFAYPRRRWA